MEMGQYKVHGEIQSTEFCVIIFAHSYDDVVTVFRALCPQAHYLWSEEIG